MQSVSHGKRKIPATTQAGAHWLGSSSAEKDLREAGSWQAGQQLQCALGARQAASNQVCTNGTSYQLSSPLQLSRDRIEHPASNFGPSSGGKT